MIIRKYQPGEEFILHEVFVSSVHENAQGYYNKQQLDAWAPTNFDEEIWIERLKGISPFVILVNNEIMGYADLQDNGYIDHFFIRGGEAQKGYGTNLMEKILAEAKRSNIKKITSNASLAAQKFFLKHGFEIVKKQIVIIKGIELENTLVKKLCC